MKMAGQHGLAKCMNVSVEAWISRERGAERARGVSLNRKTARTLDMRFKPDHSIKLAVIFGICISIWSHAKKERFAPLARLGLLGNLAG